MEAPITPPPQGIVGPLKAATRGVRSTTSRTGHSPRRIRIGTDVVADGPVLRRCERARGSQSRNEDPMEKERLRLAAARIGATTVVRLLATGADAAAFCLGHGRRAYQGERWVPFDAVDAHGRRLVVTSGSDRQRQTGPASRSSPGPRPPRGHDADQERAWSWASHRCRLPGARRRRARAQGWASRRGRHRLVPEGTVDRRTTPRHRPARSGDGVAAG